MVAMSLLDSKSEFDSRAQQVGLVEEVVQALSDKGIASLAQLGFAAGTPGTTDETSLRAWASETLGSLSVPLGQEIALRRLLFTAHTLIIASLKEEVARASSAADVVRKLPPVEREARLTKLREKLPGIDLTPSRTVLRVGGRFQRHVGGPLRALGAVSQVHQPRARAVGSLVQ